MKDATSRRIVPASLLAIVLFATLMGLQLYFLLGGMQIRTATIKRFLPFAYEPFMKMVGEHPDTRPEIYDNAETGESSFGVETIAGFSPAELEVTIEGADQPVPDIEMQDVKPLVDEPAAEPAKKEDPSDDEPVG